MKIFRRILFVILFLAIGSAGCDQGERDKEKMSAAGHPDEIKDSTRLDAADSTMQESESEKTLGGD